MDEPLEIIGGFVAGVAGEGGSGQDAALLARLKSALAATVPGLDPALITGNTLGEVEHSFEGLKALARPPAAAVPAGAPGRVASPPLSAFDKIRDGLTRLAS